VIVFGSVSQASEALVRMYARHTAVRGNYSTGKAYSGNDPLLQMWVLGTLVDTILRGQALFLDPMPREEQQAFYQESKWFAALMGIPQKELPETLDDFDEWMAAMLAGDTLMVTEQAKEIARSLLRLPLPIFWPGNYLLAVGMLPEALRDGFGLRWTLLMQAAFDAAVSAVRLVAPRLPLRLRTSPMYWRAKARAAAGVRE